LKGEKGGGGRPMYPPTKRGGFYFGYRKSGYFRKNMAVLPETWAGEGREGRKFAW